MHVDKSPTWFSSSCSVPVAERVKEAIAIMTVIIPTRRKPRILKEENAKELGEFYSI